MSNYDRNTTAPGTSADLRLRLMPACGPTYSRVYNYMAIGVG